MPLADPALLDLFLGLSWFEVNRPREKQLFREAFQVPHLPRHSNLQLGDSGIAKRFGGLTPEGAKSPIKLYNRLMREAESTTPKGTSSAAGRRR